MSDGMTEDGVLATTGTRVDASPSRDAAGIRPGPTIWFEVEDMLRYFDHSSTPTGIQRVCYEIFSEAERLFGASGRVRFCRVSAFSGHIEAIGFSTVTAAYRNPPASHRPGNGQEATAGRPGMLPKLLRLARSVPRFVRWRMRMALSKLRDHAGRRACWRRFEQRVAPGDVIVSLGSAWTNRKFGQGIDSVKRAGGVRLAVLIHDIVALVEPASCTSRVASQHTRWIMETAGRVDALFTVSDFTRRELVDYAARAGWTLPSVDVLCLGAGFGETDVAITGRVRSLPARYVLFVSTIEKRKNHAVLLRVWRRLVERHGGEAIPKLVFVGRIGWLIDDLLAELAATDFLGGKIVLLPDLSDADVREAYRRCLFTVYPSRYEGWGLPVAESLMHGKFCIASDRASLPEVGGDLIDYFDPADEDDVLAKIERVLFEPGYLAAREARLRADYRPPSWAGCARQLIDMIDERLPLVSAPMA